MGSGTAGYKREHGLTVKQQNTIDLLLQGGTHQEAADAVGVVRTTVSKWASHDPYFQAELNRRRAEIWGASVDRLRSLLLRALVALEFELEQGKQRGRVALEIVRLVGLDRSGAKCSSLEVYGVGQSDPDAIIDGIARSRRPDPLDELIRGEPVSERERQSVIHDFNRRLPDE